MYYILFLCYLYKGVIQVETGVIRNKEVRRVTDLLIPGGYEQRLIYTYIYIYEEFSNSPRSKEKHLQQSETSSSASG